MGVQYTICHWAINRTDSQNLLSIILDVPLHHSGYTLRLEWYPLLAKNGKTPVVALGVLL